MDRLTQLQDALDQLTTQFYASLRYLGTHAPPAPVTPGSQPIPDPNRPSDTLEELHKAQTELARDIIVKTKQIELLIYMLPGVGVSEDEQVERLRALEEQLRAAEREREEEAGKREEVLRRVQEVVGKLRRV